MAALAPIPLSSKLQTLPEDVQEMVSAHLALRDLCALGGVCQGLREGLRRPISIAQAGEPAYLQRMLQAYQSPAHILGAQSQRPPLDQLDWDIRVLEGRLREIHDRDEIGGIEGRLNALRASRLPPRRVIDSILAYSHPFSDVIDTRQWNALIGRVPNRPLLPGIKTSLGQPCSLFHGKTRDETHVCIDVPPTVDGQPLTLNRLCHFAEHNRGNQIRLNIHWNRILQALGDAPIPEGQFLLLKTCLPGTKGKTYQQQREVLDRHLEYMEATLPQVLVASLMEYIRSGGAKTSLFEEEYARTSTTVDNWRLAFGGFGFGSGWSSVGSNDDDSANGDFGLAVVLRPPG